MTHSRGPAVRDDHFQPANWQPGRFGATASDEQIIRCHRVSALFLWHGLHLLRTDQGFDGRDDYKDISEAMFDKATPRRNLLNLDCKIYQEIAQIAQL